MPSVPLSTRERHARKLIKHTRNVFKKLAENSDLDVSCPDIQIRETTVLSCVIIGIHSYTLTVFNADKPLVSLQFRYSEANNKYQFNMHAASVFSETRRTARLEPYEGTLPLRVGETYKNWANLLLEIGFFTDTETNFVQSETT
jgi:hypothetical protein